MRLVLGFDTATERCAIALGRWPEGADVEPPEVVAEYDFEAPRAAMSRLLPAVREMLESRKLDVADLGAVIVGRGPGSFTGVRIGVATAKGIAQGLSVPLYGTGTPDAVARRFLAYEGLLGVVGDAMRGEVYPTLFRCGSGWVERLGAYSVACPEAAARRWAETAEGPILLAGNGLAKYEAVFARVLGRRASVADAELWGPTGSGVLGAAWDGLGETGLGRVDELLPIYTRLSDAEEAEHRRSGLGAVPLSTGVAGPEEGPRRREGTEGPIRQAGAPPEAEGERS